MASSTQEDTVRLLAAFAECHRNMRAFADALRLHTKVKSVTHWLDLIPFKDGFRIEEFVDAELLDGGALAWCLEISGTGDRLALEADVRRAIPSGQEVISVIAEDAPLGVAECVSEVKAVVRSLCAVRPRELA